MLKNEQFAGPNEDVQLVLIEDDIKNDDDALPIMISLHEKLQSLRDASSRLLLEIKNCKTSLSDASYVISSVKAPIKGEIRYDPSKKL
jgi:hypothetical protein